MPEFKRLKYKRKSKLILIYIIIYGLNLGQDGLIGSGIKMNITTINPIGKRSETQLPSSGHALSLFRT